VLLVAKRCGAREREKRKEGEKERKKEGKKKGERNLPQPRKFHAHNGNYMKVLLRDNCTMIETNQL
jgi:hypothetical protein